MEADQLYKFLSFVTTYLINIKYKIIYFEYNHKTNFNIQKALNFSYMGGGVNLTSDLHFNLCNLNEHIQVPLLFITIC